jgi:predicted dehydrogenase
MGKLTSVLIGCGAIAREHLNALSRLDTVEITAVCDISAARAEAAAERFRIARWYTSHQKMLDDVRPDLVHITTPPASHFPIAKSCLEARLNVLCEKPITIDYAQFNLLKQLATENNCMLIENQSMRFHSSIRRIQRLIDSGELGDLLDVQISVLLNLFAADSPYSDRNAPHFGLALRGGVIGDFLPHIAYTARMFTGPIVDVRTIWSKRTSDSPLPADEFRALVRGERATAHLCFSGNAGPNGFLLRLTGTRMRLEADLFEPPRLIFKRLRAGEPALMTLIDGVVESRDVLADTVASFWQKLAGRGQSDGLPEVIARTYRALASRQPQPISLQDIDESVRLVESLTRSDLEL